MAVIQISRVQHRRGQTSQTGFPQLASGEFGWSIDQQELYIGNGAVSEGAPAVGNTRLITEHDGNFFLVTSPTYIYENSPNGPTVQTGPDSNPYTLRFIQEKLDDRVNLRDFGAVGDGATDDTAAIQRAISYVSKNKKILDVNEGTFLVGEILVPPFSELRGAGMNKTTFISTGTLSILKTVGLNGSGLMTDISSAIQTPRDINIYGITFISSATSALPMVDMVGVLNGSIDNCEFKATSTIASTGTMATGISLDAVGAITCNQVNINNCVFNHLGTSISSNSDIINIKIYNNSFNNVDSGIIFSNNLTGGQGSQYGPTYVGISGNDFNNINNQGVYVGQNLSGYSFIRSSDNTYNNVGVGYNNSLGELQQSTDVITYKTFSNESNNDIFGRLIAINKQPLTNFTGSIKPIVNGPIILQDVNSNGGTSIPATSTQQLLVLPRGIYYAAGSTITTKYVRLNYTLTRDGNLIRQGIFEVNINNNTGDYIMDDKFTCTGNTDGDLVFSIELTRSDVVIINATNSGTLCEVDYSVYVRQ